MTERDMKKLSRLELLEILLAQGREIERLRAEIAALERRAAAAPVSEPAPLTEEFLLTEEGPCPPQEGAPAADSDIADVLAEARALLDRTQTLSGETEELCCALHERTEEECTALREDAQRKAKAYWDEVSAWVREGKASGQWDEQS